MSKAKDILDKFSITEMASIRKASSQLPMILWASPNPCVGHKGIRCKVSKIYSDNFDSNNSFSLYFDGNDIKVDGDTGEIKPRDVELAKKFFRKYKEIFELFWDKKIGDDEFKRMIAQAVKKSGGKL